MAESELQTAGAESGADDAHTSVTVGELLVRCLALEGVDFMCGIVDGAHIPFVRHTGAYGISYVNTRHEEAAAHVAEAYTRLAHRPAVVIGTPANSSPSW